MENRLPCEIVQDLLPSYVDGLTSEVTNQAVRSHVQTCENCRQSMTAMGVSEPERSLYEEREIDFLKKTKRKHRRILGISLAAVLIVVLSILALVRVYLIGDELDADLISCQVSVQTREQADGSMESEIQVKGILLDSGIDVTQVAFSEDDGVVTICVKGGTASPFCESVFQESYVVSGPVTEIYVGDRILWDQGVEISPYVADIYATKHPYVGDMTANGATARALGLGQLIGDFTNQLQTTEEPYGWIMYKENPITADQEQELLKKVESLSYVMIAMTDNLGYMTYVYEVDGVEKDVTFSVDTVPGGKDLKQEVASSARDLALFMEEQGLGQYVSTPEWNGSKIIQIGIANAAEDEILGLGITYSLDGEVIGSEETIHADESVIQSGEITYFDIAESDLPLDALTDISRLQIAVTVYTGNHQYETVHNQIDVDADFGHSYQIALCGDADSGYILE